MATDSIRVSAVIPASPERIQRAWLDSEEHTGFTGSEAEVEPGVGGKFRAWEGYIEGTTLEIEEGKIIQSWRTSDFPSASPDSRVEIILVPSSTGTRITIVHTNIPEGQGQGYERGWKDYYFQPMKAYFSEVE